MSIDGTIKILRALVLMLSLINFTLADENRERTVTVCEFCEDGHGPWATFESTRLKPGSTYNGTDEIVKCLSTFNITMIAEKGLVAEPNTNYYVWVDNGDYNNQDYLRELQKKAMRQCLPDDDDDTDIEVLSIHEYHALRPRDATWDGHNVHQYFGITEDCECGMSQEGTYPLHVTGEPKSDTHQAGETQVALFETVELETDGNTTYIEQWSNIGYPVGDLQRPWGSFHEYMAFIAPS